MADVALVAGETLATPLQYLIPGAQEIVPKAVTAEYDGSGAGGDFVPTLIIRAPNGSVLAHAPIGSALTAGASADVSWFPRGGVGSGTPPPSSGIQFGIDNEGNWLEIGVNDFVPGHGGAGQVLKNSGNDNVGNVVRIEGLQQNPGTGGMIGLIVFGNTDDGESANEGVGAIINAGQFHAGPAVAAILRTLAGADVTGLQIELTGDGGANKKGILTDSPVCFSADQGPATGTPVLAQLYLVPAGGGQHSLVARAGSTDVTLVTG
jgi:hypothetical protein